MDMCATCVYVCTYTDGSVHQLTTPSPHLSRRKQDGDARAFPMDWVSDGQETLTESQGQTVVTRARLLPGDQGGVFAEHEEVERAVTAWAPLAAEW